MSNIDQPDLAGRIEVPSTTQAGTDGSEIAGLVERLLEPCVDWTGEQIVDNSTPRYEIHCALLREAAAALVAAHAEIALLSGSIDILSADMAVAQAEIERLTRLLTAATERLAEYNKDLHSTKAAVYLLRNERDNMADNVHEASTRATTAEAKVAEMTAALTAAETVMMIVEPRSHKAEYLAALEKVRAALTVKP